MELKPSVACDKHPAMLKQIAAVISDSNTNIRNMEAKTAEEHATVEIVADLEHLDRIVTGVRKIPGVRDVQRLQKL